MKHFFKNLVIAIATIVCIATPVKAMDKGKGTPPTKKASSTPPGAPTKKNNGKNKKEEKRAIKPKMLYKSEPADEQEMDMFFEAMKTIEYDFLMAIESNDINQVASFLTQFINTPNDTFLEGTLFDASFYGKTGLMIAAQNGNLEITSLLLECKAEIDRQDSKGETALLYAYRSGNTNIAELLINNGASIDLAFMNLVENERIAPSKSGVSHITKAVRLLVFKGADTNELFNFETYPPHIKDGIIEGTSDLHKQALDPWLIPDIAGMVAAYTKYSAPTNPAPAIVLNNDQSRRPYQANDSDEDDFFIVD